MGVGRKKRYVRGSETWPVTSLEGAMGVLLYGIVDGPAKVALLRGKMGGCLDVFDGGLGICEVQKCSAEANDASVSRDWAEVGVGRVESGMVRVKDEVVSRGRAEWRYLSINQSGYLDVST